METVSRKELAKSVAAQHNISTPRAAMLVTIAAAELELEGTTYSLRQAGELEAIIARKQSK
ncbi:hypothetical protein SEA_ORCANUS_32 [Arthrobacter phage Orcanus]|nr:hypothetical protein SEA_ORCANUS_32 [Arthrobacter phage Orcanus]WAB09141.1 hypothetical protein SEA_EESA_31 [Arthrobacter phage Eesa]